ncbi:hypothetical protein ABIB73_006236 [Bradyrhizobium sp. F1.4.3]
MPAVHKRQSQAKDLYNGAGRGRGRPANNDRSWFVLAALATVNITVGASLEIRTATCQVPSGSRDIAPAAKLQLPEDRSVTIGWRPFNQA